MTTVEVDATTTVGDFTVKAMFHAGQGITAFFGPSGSGKSVTLSTVAGLLRPKAGTVIVDGRAVADAASGLHVPSQQRRIGMVFQHAALLPHRSPLDNVALAAPGRRRRDRRAVAVDWLDRVGADHLAHAPTRTLSGGEQQRVALARALAGKPSLLLLDEPFSAVDGPTRTQLRALVRKLVVDEALTALLVTHDLEDITDLAQRIVQFEPGRTVATHDPPRDDLSILIGHEWPTIRQSGASADQSTRP